MGRFFILCVGVVMDTQMGVRPAGERQTGVCRRAKRMSQGSEAQRNQSLRCYQNSNRVYPGFNFGIVVADEDPGSDKKAGFASETHQNRYGCPADTKC